jgi:hypothetical protein
LRRFFLHPGQETGEMLLLPPVVPDMLS